MNIDQKGITPYGLHKQAKIHKATALKLYPDREYIPLTAHHMGVLPFSTWEYRPPYLPASLNIPVAKNAAVLTEPVLFYLVFGQRPDTYPPEKYQPLEHAAGLCELTRAELVTPYMDSLSPELKAKREYSSAQITFRSRVSCRTWF